MASTAVLPRTVVPVETLRSQGDVEYMRTTAALRGHLVVLSKALRDARVKVDGDLEKEEEAEEKALRDVETVLGELGETLSACKRTLPRLRCASTQHLQYYGEVMRWLEARRDAIMVGLCKEKALRLKALATRNAAFRDSAVPLRVAVAKPAKTLYKNLEPDPALDVVISEQERVQLQLENDQLRMEEMNRLTEKARDIQRQLGTLAQLMTVFSVEIVRQKEDMLRIIDVTIKATINVEQGNKKLIEASSSSVDFRFFVLLFLILLSVALVFLQWYS